MEELTPSEVVPFDGQRFARRRLVGTSGSCTPASGSPRDRSAGPYCGRRSSRTTRPTSSGSGTARYRRDSGAGRGGPCWRPRPGGAGVTATHRSGPSRRSSWSSPPGGSEGRAGRRARRLLLRRRPGRPWAYVVDLVGEGLVARKLLERRPERWFRLRTGRSEYGLPDRAPELAARSPPERVERLFAATETARPEVGELLGVEMDGAVDARLETTTHHGPHWDTVG